MPDLAFEAVLTLEMGEEASRETDDAPDEDDNEAATSVTKHMKSDAMAVK